VALNDPHDIDPVPKLLRIVIIALLTLHLLYFSSHMFGAYLMWGYALERQASLGVPATPFIIMAILIVIVFVLFVLTLIFFIKKNKKYLLFASIAGIGGFLSNLVFAMVSDPDMLSAGLQLRAVISYGAPMIFVFLYHKTFSNRHNYRD
jgi:hypothetical protein